MNLSAQDIITRPRDSIRERKLALEIRELPEEERFELIRELLLRDHVVALIMANACLRKKAYFEELLEYALRTVDISDMKHWLKCIVPRLGFRNVVLHLLRKLDCDPASGNNVEKARYQLMRFVPRGDMRAVKTWRELNKVMGKRGLISKPLFLKSSFRNSPGTKIV